MATTIEEFPHRGEHLVNDESLARITLYLLGMFAVAMAIVLTAALRSM